jgi:ABC-2 type transport system permease protein
VIPIAIVLIIPGPTQLSRLPLACVLIFFYLIFVHTLSFSLASFAFFFNRVYAFTAAKNIALWVLTGELFPLDIMPEPFRHVIISLPFASAVYLPVGYLTGRFDESLIFKGLLSVAIGTAIIGTFAAFIWSAGRRRYSGTGA